jgi:hypothetical protein
LIQIFSSATYSQIFCKDPAILHLQTQHIYTAKCKKGMRGKLHGNLEMLSEVMRYKQHVSLFWTPPKQGNKK